MVYQIPAQSQIHYRVRNNSGRAVSDLVVIGKEKLTPAQLPRRRSPPEIEWLANITNPKTRSSHKDHVAEFLFFTGLQDSAAPRTVARSHVIAWRKDLEARSLQPASIRRKRSAPQSVQRSRAQKDSPVQSLREGGQSRGFTFMYPS